MEYKEYISRSKFNDISEDEYSNCIEPVYNSIQSLTKDQCVALYDVVHAWKILTKIAEKEEEISTHTKEIGRLQRESLNLLASAKLPNFLKSSSK